MVLRRGEVEHEQREWVHRVREGARRRRLRRSFRFRRNTSPGLGGQAVPTKNTDAIRAGQTSNVDYNDDRILLYPAVLSCGM